MLSLQGLMDERIRGCFMWSSRAQPADETKGEIEVCNKGLMLRLEGLMERRGCLMGSSRCVRLQRLMERRCFIYEVLKCLA